MLLSQWPDTGRKRRDPREDRAMTLRAVMMLAAIWLSLPALTAMPATTAMAAEPSGEPYVINVVLPLSGNAAFLGQEQQQVLQLLTGKVNRQGGIRGQPLQLAFHDDQSSPQTAVQIATEVIATRPAVILGSALVGMCNAMAPLVKNGPLLFCLSPGFHPAAGSFAFTSGAATDDSMRTMLRQFRARGWTRIAMISSTDATGQDADRSMAQVMAEMPDLRMVEQSHFNLSDVSVIAQLERIKSAQPDALIAWSSGTALATIFKAVLQTGLEVPIGTTAGNFVYAQMARFADLLPPRLFVASALFPEHPGYHGLDARVEAVQQDFYAVLRAGNMLPDNMAGTSWDAGMLVVDALRALGPQASARDLRGWIGSQTDWPGINGLYDFHAKPERGVQQKDTVLTRWDAPSGRFVWASAPGGGALP
jgi:branched-chain amino acid transport system substrate-binding protein